VWVNGSLIDVRAGAGRWALGVLVLLAAAAALQGQAPRRIATTPSSLVASPVFFHGKQIAVRGSVSHVGDLGRLQVPVDEADLKRRPGPQILLFWKEPPARTEGEIRGEFWDLGRINSDDGRFASYDFKPMLEAVTQGRWPAREELYVILGALMVDSPLPPTPTLRALVLAPDHYNNRELSVSGRFRGRNLYGDLPGPLNKSKWDFVLQSADAAVWTTGLRPRGRDFDLDPGARVDTGRWLKVTGIARAEGSNVWIEAKSMELSSPPNETQVEIAVPATPQAPAPTVVFSAPVPDEGEVERNVVVRIQFSWDMDPKSFRDRVRVTYAPAQGQAPPPAFAATYAEGSRALQIKFTSRLERFQTVKIELLEGIQSTDGQALKPWTLTFTTGS
jgi:hypothetical protein